MHSWLWEGTGLELLGEKFLNFMIAGWIILDNYVHNYYVIQG